MEKLIFVYNADSGFLNGIKDLMHKNFSPETYECRLCAVTYNNFGMIREWNTFTASLKTPVEFLHRDELALMYGIKDVLLPAVFVQKKNKGLHLWINSIEMNACQSLEHLKELVQKKLE